MTGTIDVHVPVLRRNLMSHLMVPGNNMPVRRSSVASPPMAPRDNGLAVMLNHLKGMEERIAGLEQAVQAVHQAPVVFSAPPNYVPEPLPKSERRHEPVRRKREGVLRRIMYFMAD